MPNHKPWSINHNGLVQHTVAQQLCTTHIARAKSTTLWLRTICFNYIQQEFKFEQICSKPVVTYSYITFCIFPHAYLKLVSWYHWALFPKYCLEMCQMGGNLWSSPLPFSSSPPQSQVFALLCRGWFEEMLYLPLICMPDTSGFNKKRIKGILII